MVASTRCTSPMAPPGAAPPSRQLPRPRHLEREISPESRPQFAALKSVLAISTNWWRWAGFARSQIVQMASESVGSRINKLATSVCSAARRLQGCPECSRVGHALTSKCVPASGPVDRRALKGKPPVPTPLSNISWLKFPLGCCHGSLLQSQPAQNRRPLAS